MRRRGSPAGRLAVILAVVLMLGLVGVTLLVRHWQRRGLSLLAGYHHRTNSGGAGGPGFILDDGSDPARAGRAADILEAESAGPLLRPDDPRLSSLREAAETWRRSTGPRRVVIDQVCLVPDVPAFLEAIAAWDERHFFPILIDEPAWTLPFLRAFRPSRVVRYDGRDRGAPPNARPGGTSSPSGARDVWRDASRAVSQAWSSPAADGAEPRSAGAVLKQIGPTPPGLVLTTADSPMLAGAVALAAGRFQRLVWLELGLGSSSSPGDPGRTRRFDDVLTLYEARQFALRIEGGVASLGARYDQLGDECDFLTIAADWPYRYANDVEDGPARGIQSLDDLVGRVLDRSPGGSWLNRSRLRWAYVGRLLGDPAASVARAMGALFLRPGRALLWNTYGRGAPWSDYAMGPAADHLARTLPDPGAVEHHAGLQSDLASWHRTFDPAHRFGLIMINSSGNPRDFAIAGGPGRPGDVPRGLPAAVAMIHSFSAANPADPQTIAGRWLAQGAFVYYGSVQEPYLHAFRPPRLVAGLIAAGVPLVAALRQGEFEPFGRPWRLIYLGDPLYRIEAQAGSPTARTGAHPQIATESPERHRGLDRLGVGDWRRIAPEYASWRVVEIPGPAGRPGPPPESPAARSEDVRLAWCLDAAIGELTAPSTDDRPSTPGGGHGIPPAHSGAVEWLPILREIHRERLDRRLRPVLDDLLIDALGETGAFEELHARLIRIPLDERGPRVWQSLEWCTLGRLARLTRDPDPTRGFGRALDLWDEVIRLTWPSGSEFPAQLTERVAALAAVDGTRRLGPWRDGLRQAREALAAQPDGSAREAVVAAELKRIEAQPRRRGFW